MASIAVNCQIFSLQGLHYEIADYAAVMGVHSRAVGIENAHHLDRNPILTVIIETECFGAPLSLVVTGPEADGIDISPVVFPLRMYQGIAVDLAGGGLQHFALDPLGQAEHVDGAHDVCFYRLDRIDLVVDGRGRAGQVIDFIYLEHYGLGDVVADQLDIRKRDEVDNIVLCPCKKIVETEDVVSFGGKSLAQMGSQKTRAPRHQDSFFAGDTPFLL